MKINPALFAARKREAGALMHGAGRGSWDQLDDAPKNRFKSGLTLTWAPTGALDVGGQPPDLGPDLTSVESWLGHHLLTFP